MSVPELYTEPPETSPPPPPREEPREPVSAQAPRPGDALDDSHLFRRHRLRPLPLWLRIIVLFVGWIVVLIGIAGLVLPGPGTVGIVLGVAILSVASQFAYKWMRRTLHRWPTIWDRVERFRDKIHDRLHDFVHRSRID